MEHSPIPYLDPDGSRGLVVRALAAESVAGLASVLGEYFSGAAPVLVARDLRTTSAGIAAAIAGALPMSGREVVELGPMPIPALRFAVREMGARAGLMVTAGTAAHEPPRSARIRLIGPGGDDLPLEEVRELERRLHRSPPIAAPRHGGGSLRNDGKGVARYLGSIVAQVDAGPMRSARPRVALDCDHGTSALATPQLLSQLGCQLTTLNALSDPAPIGPAPEGERGRLADLARAVVATGALLGIAHDGDSDRVAFVDETGRPVPGAAALALLAGFALDRHPHARVVASLTSSSALETVVAQRGGDLRFAAPGDRAMISEVRRLDAKFGGNEAGEYCWPEHLCAPDGPMSAVRMVELLLASGAPLSVLVDRLPTEATVSREVPLPLESRTSVMQRVQRTLAGEAKRVVDADAVKAFYDDGWVLVGPAGSEPSCRITAGSRSEERARELLERGAKLVSDLVSAFTYDGGGGDLWCDPA